MPESVDAQTTQDASAADQQTSQAPGVPAVDASQTSDASQQQSSQAPGVPAVDASQTSDASQQQPSEGPEVPEEDASKAGEAAVAPDQALASAASDPVTQNTSGDVGGTCQPCGGSEPTPPPAPPPQMAHIQVHVQDPSGNPIQGVDVAVDGQGLSGLTDSNGDFDFGDVPPDVYTVEGRKVNYTPTPQSESKPAPAAAPTIYQLVLTPPKVVRINAKLPTTNSVRGTAAIPAPLATHDFGSDSSDKSLAGNPPTVLVRNCADISLEAVTDPPSVADVVWNVEANPGGDSAPSVSPASGVNATLKANAAGGYVVSASLPGSVVYWNIVLAEVQISNSSVLKGDNFTDTSSPNFVNCKTGIFDVAQPAQCAMYAKAETSVYAGGDASLDTYLDRVHVGFPQNLTSDTAAASYDGGGTEKERVVKPPRPASPIIDPSVAVADLGYPVLDRGGDVATRATGGGTIFLSRSQSTPPDGKDRVIEVCDGPAVGFNALLPKFHAAATAKASGVAGVNAFRVYLAAYSDDANYSYVVFGQFDWTADYGGTVDWSSGSPKWVKGSAQVTGDGSVTRIDHGKEAQQAGCEVRPPVYLDYVLDAR